MFIPGIRHLSQWSWTFAYFFRVNDYKKTFFNQVHCSAFWDCILCDEHLMLAVDIIKKNRKQAVQTRTTISVELDVSMLLS